MNQILQGAWIIPVLPLLAFVIIGMFLHRWPKWAATVSILAIGLAMLYSLLVALEVFSAQPGEVFVMAVPWLNMPGLQVNMGILIDFEHGDAFGGNHRSIAGTGLFFGVYGGRPGVCQLFRLPEHFCRFHAGPGLIQQFRKGLCLLGIGGALLLFADRLLV